MAPKPKIKKRDVASVRLMAHAYGFEHFWSIYPNRKQRSIAERSFVFNLTPDERETLELKTRDYLARREFAERNGVWVPYLPNPSTYLNQRRWEDSFPTDRMMGKVEVANSEAAALAASFMDRFGEGVFDERS